MTAPKKANAGGKAGGSRGAKVTGQAQDSARLIGRQAVPAQRPERGAGPLRPFVRFARPSEGYFRSAFNAFLDAGVLVRDGDYPAAIAAGRYAISRTCAAALWGAHL